MSGLCGERLEFKVQGYRGLPNALGFFSGSPPTSDHCHFLGPFLGLSESSELESLLSDLAGSNGSLQVQ